jgi:signal transduction histidine kinase
MNLIQQQPEQERIHVALPSQLLARLEPDFFQTMVSNLLDNALGYSPPKSPVHVSLQDMPASGVRPRHLMLTVRNTLGKAGLPDPKRLFEKYYRAQGAHQRTGSGLGLYLVKSLAERAQGGIGHRAEKNTDVGGESHTCVVFELWLPCR